MQHRRLRSYIVLVCVLLSSSCKSRYTWRPLIAFFLAWRFICTRRMLPERSVTISGSVTSALVPSLLKRWRDHGTTSSIGNWHTERERLALKPASHEGAFKPVMALCSRIRFWHLKRAFVGVERFAVRKEACDFVVGDDAFRLPSSSRKGPCNGPRGTWPCRTPWRAPHVRP